MSGGAQRPPVCSRHSNIHLTVGSSLGLIWPLVTMHSTSDESIAFIEQSFRYRYRRLLGLREGNAVSFPSANAVLKVTRVF